MILIFKEIRSNLTRKSQKLNQDYRNARRFAKDKPEVYEQLVGKFLSESELLLEESLAQVLADIPMDRQEFDDLFSLYENDEQVKDVSILINTPEEYAW